METKGVYSPMDRYTVTQTAMTILNKPYPLFRDEKPTRYIDLANRKSPLILWKGILQLMTGISIRYYRL